MKRLASTEVLHTRWLKLSNSESWLEVLNASALTEGVGPHPLFNGVRRLILTGLAGEPAVEDSAGALLVRVPGFAGTFQTTEIERGEQTLTVRLEKP